MLTTSRASSSARQRGEVDDVREQDAHLVEVVRDRVGIRLEALRDLGREDVDQERLDARLRGVPSLRKRHEQHHRDERDDEDVEDVEGPDEAVGKVGAVRPDHFGEDEGEQHRGDEGRKPRPGTAGAAEGDCPERREQRPQDHRARLLEAADHDHSQRRRDENQKQLRGPQELEAPGPREDAEADRRSGGVRPRRERDRVLTDEPVQAAPDDRDREDGERDADEKPFPEALVGRVARIRSDRERVIDQRLAMTTSVDEALACAVRPACAESRGDFPSPRLARRRPRARDHARGGRLRRSDEENASEQWAGDVCSQLSTWVTGVEEAVRSLTENPLSLDKAAVQAATEDVKGATEELVDGLADLGPPETESGDQAQSELDELGTQLQQQVDEVEQEAEAGSLSLVTVTSALATAASAVRSTYESIQSLDSGELRDAFENAASCDSFRQQVDTIGD